MEALSYQERINRVLRHIESHLNDRLNLYDLADIACFSPYHFHRIFSAMTGESLAAYIRRLRLQQAANIIIYTNESITQIASIAGYDSIDAFTRAFRAQFGMTPSEYWRTESPFAPAVSSVSDIPLCYHNIQDLPPANISLKTFLPVITFAVRYAGSYYECGPAWDRLFSVLGAHGLLSEVLTGYCMTHDNPDMVPEEKCRMDVCLPLPDGMATQSPVVRHILHNKDIYLKTVGEAYDYAVARIQGPYRSVYPAFRSLYGKWIPQSGRKPANASSFIIFSGFSQTHVPLSLMMEICAPLQPRLLRTS